MIIRLYSEHLSQHLKRLLLLICSMLIALGCVEFLLRKLNIPKFLVSEWSLHTADRAGDAKACIINSPFYSKIQHTKKPGERLVFAIGDSFTEGYPVQGEGYPERLQEKFEKEYGDSLRIINFGIADSGTDQQMRIFKEFILPAIKPDIVIWSLYPNDIYDNVNYAMYTISSNNTLQPIDCKKSFLYVRWRLNTAPLPRIVKDSKLFTLFLKSTEILIEHRVPEQFKKDVSLWGYIKLIKEIDEISALARENNFEIYYVFIAPQVIYGLGENEWLVQKYDLMKQIKTRIKPQDHIIDIDFRMITEIESQKIFGKPIDVGKELFADNSQDVNLLGDRHFNARGYQLFADMVFNSLVKNSAVIQQIKNK